MPLLPIGQGGTLRRAGRCGPADMRRRSRSREDAMRHDYNVDARRSAQPSQWRPSLVMTTGAGMHAHVMEHFEPISKLEVLHGG